MFRTLQYGIAQEKPVGALTQELVTQAHDATLFGVPLYGTFMRAAETPHPLNTKILTVTLIILMSITTFTTQRQLLLKNTAADNPMVRQQKILSYIFPFVFAISGVGFPVGVLFYWLTTNLWTMGQQFWVIRNNPMGDARPYGLPAASGGEAGAEGGKGVRGGRGGIGDGEPHGV